MAVELLYYVLAEVDASTALLAFLAISTALSGHQVLFNMILYSQYL
jgi:hypothetical protein